MSPVIVFTITLAVVPDVEYIIPSTVMISAERWADTAIIKDMASNKRLCFIKIRN